jgi:hypothetical protein
LIRINVALLALALAACTPTPSGPTTSAGPYLAPYAGQETQLFDDTFAPEAFGAFPDQSEPLAARARAAEGVVPVRVRTVTRDTSTESESYIVDVVPSGPALKGPNPTTSLTLTVPASSASFPLVRASEAGLVGSGLLLFYKRFQDRGAVVLHWRAELDTPRVRKAVEEATLLGELSQ